MSERVRRDFLLHSVACIVGGVITSGCSSSETRTPTYQPADVSVENEDTREHSFTFTCQRDSEVVFQKAATIPSSDEIEYPHAIPKPTQEDQEYLAKVTLDNGTSERLEFTYSGVTFILVIIRAFDDVEIDVVVH